MLKLDVPPNHFRRHLISNRSYEVSITPQLSSPQLLPQPWITTKYLPRQDTLQYLYNSTRTVLRWCHQKQLDMIRHHLKRVNFHLITLCNTIKDLLQSFSNTTLQDQLPVLRSPNEVILEVVHCVPSSPNRAHLSHTNSFIRLRRISASLPPASWGVSTGGPL